MVPWKESFTIEKVVSHGISSRTIKLLQQIINKNLTNPQTEKTPVPPNTIAKNSLPLKDCKITLTKN